MVPKGFLCFLVILVVKMATVSNETSDESTNTESYQNNFNDVMDPLKFEDENTKENDTSCLTYDRVIRNLRKNWQMPVNYLQQRGYLTKRDSKISIPSKELSMDAYNLINGPLLNPSTHINLYPIQSQPTIFESFKSEKRENTDGVTDQEGIDNGTKTSSFDEKLFDLNSLNNEDELGYFDPSLGDNWIKNMKQQWNSWFKKNSTELETTTESPQTVNPIILNDTQTNSNDLSFEDARDGLEFFKIYNNFMLAKLASKLSESTVEHPQIIHKEHNQTVEQPQIIHNERNDSVVAGRSNFSKITDSDIEVLKALNSCLKIKNNQLKDIGVHKQLDGVTNKNNTPGTVDDAQVSNNYLSTKLKFLAHLHHEVFNIGRISSLSQDQSKFQPNLNGNDDSIDCTTPGTTNMTYLQTGEK